MAITQLVNAIIPEVYQSYTAVDGPELTAFYESGLLVRNEAIDNALKTGGKECHLPFWKDLDATVEPNYSNDDPASIAVPDNVVAGEMVARIAEMNKGFSTADLVAEMAGSNPMQRIRDRFGKYWSRQIQRRLIKTCAGIYADNVANDAGDMVRDISIADGAAVGVDNLFSRGAFTSAIFTLGDAFGDLTAIAVHSIVLKRMIDNDDIEFRMPSEPDPNIPLTKQTVPYYMGKRVIVDDGMPVLATGVNSGYKFTSILFGEGAIGFGERDALVPVETVRLASQGNGGGIEQIWERRSMTVHPFGFKFLSGVVAGNSATFAELANALNWDRVIERKNVPIAFLVTNG